MTSGNRDAKNLARKLMLGEASWGKEPMPKTVNYTQALARANQLILDQRATKAQIAEDWKPVTFKEIREEARELEKTEGIRYMDAIARVEQDLRHRMPEPHKMLADAWESFLEHTVLDYKILTNRGEFGPWLKVREMRLDGKPEVTAIQMYIETLSGELHLSNMWMNDEPALFNLPGDGLLRFVQKSEFGDTREVSVSIAMSTDHSVFSKRFAGMFDIISKEMDMDGKRKLSDILEVVPRPHIRDVETWQDFHKKDLVRIGMYYGESPVLGHGGGVQDARYATLHGNSTNNNIYVYPEGFAFQSDYEPTLGALGSENLIVWIPVGDGTYRHTMPVEACAPNEFAKQLIDIIMDVQEHGIIMAVQGLCGVPNCYGCTRKEFIFEETNSVSGEVKKVSESYLLLLQHVSSRIVNFIRGYSKTGRKPEANDYLHTLKDRLAHLPEHLVKESLERAVTIAFAEVEKAEEVNPGRVDALMKNGVFGLELPHFIVLLTETFSEEKSFASVLESVEAEGSPAENKSIGFMRSILTKD